MTNNLWRRAKHKPTEVEFREVQPVMFFGAIAKGEEILTRDGALRGFVGEDYIIKGVEGEVYPIKKTIFEKTYDIID